MFRNGLACAGFLLPVAAFAQGGPPLITDDPGTPGAGNWEINLASLWSGAPAGNVVELPYGDFNYGWGEHLQLKFETGWVITDIDPQGFETGAGTALVGVKWRFLDEEANGIAVSTYPQIDFHHFLSSTNPVITNPGTHYLLPIEASKSFGRFTVNPEAGYIFETQSPSELMYGIVGAYEFQKDREALLEFHGQSRPAAGGSELLFNIGTNFLLTPGSSLLLAIGHTFVTYNDDVPHFLGYLGVQLRI